MGDVDYDEDYDGGATKGHKSTSKSPPGVDLGAITEVLKANLNQILPAILTIEQNIEIFIRFVRPYVKQGYKQYEEIRTLLKPYGLNEISKIVTGFLMMFFGGFFITTVAVYEAVMQGGYENFKANFSMLYDQFQSFKEANEKDDSEDLDNDGVADVLQISPTKYTMRKFLLALRSTEPNVLAQGMHNVYTIFIAVCATLRLQFARTISLGASIGDQLSQVAEKFVSPALKTAIDDDYDKWVDPTLMYVCRFAGVAIAFWIQRILSTVHTSVKGARVFTSGVTELAERNGKGYLTAGYLDEALAAGLAVAGIILQLFMWKEMPVFVKLAFFPAFLVESILSFFVSVTMTATSAGNPGTV